MVNLTLIVIGILLIVGVIILPNVIANLHISSILNPTHFDFTFTKKLFTYSGFFGGIILIIAGIFMGNPNKNPPN